MPSINLIYASIYFESVLGVPPDSVPMVPLSSSEVVSILWPLNNIFSSRSVELKNAVYRDECEGEADRAIQLFAVAPTQLTWEPFDNSVWKVLYERHTQMLMIAMANEAAGNKIVTYLPKGLPKESELPGVMLLLLHSMPLPSKSAD